MADLIFSTQRDEDGIAYFTEQQVTNVGKAVFSVQRNSSGAVFFADQNTAAVQAEINLAAVLSSVSNVLALMTADQTSLIARLSSVSSAAGTISLPDIAMSARLASASSLSAAVTTFDKVLRVALSSASSLHSVISVGTTTLVARLASSSVMSAIVQLGTISTIPRNAKLRAVPADEDTLQIVRYRGDNYADSFAVFYEKSGEIVNIDGCTFKMSVSTGTRCDPDRVLQYTLIGSVDDAENGRVSFAPSVEQSNLVGFYFYDVEMRDSLGIVRTLVSDSYVYKQDITP